MGLREDVQADIAEAFDADLADAVRPFEGGREQPGSYDPVTGTTPSVSERYRGRGVFGSFAQDEIDGQHIIQTDVKLLALANEIAEIDDTGETTGNPEAPQIGDELEQYRVVNVWQDPAKASWTIQLRKA